MRELKLLVRMSSVLIAATVLGCGGGHYYKVADPASDKVYYTTKVENVRGGAIKFHDDRTKHSITLQNSDVKEVSQKDYKTGIVSQVPPEKTASPSAEMAPK